MTPVMVSSRVWRAASLPRFWGSSGAKMAGHALSRTRHALGRFRPKLTDAFLKEISPNFPRAEVEFQNDAAQIQAWGEEAGQAA